MKLPHVSEIRERMTEDQREIADEMHARFYTSEYGDSEPVLCSSQDEDGEKYLKKVDLKDFD